jgi:HEAT repeat protein
VDLSPEVREEAVNQLRGRPPEESRDLLLHALRYPWAPVIDHAAEALAALGDKEAAPALVPLLDQPDPALPALIKKDKEEVKLVPELVRVNHLRNCVLCHSPSLDLKDMVRGAVPAPGKPLPAPAGTPQYYETGERFVRADVTYLRQDFSVMQPAAQPGVWPEYQRFDYLVRLRRPKPREYEAVVQKKRPLGDEPREAVLFALRELTGRDAGATAAAWRTALGRVVAEKPAAGGAPAGDDWKQFRTALQPGADGPLSAAADRLKDQLLAAEGPARGDFIRQLSENAGLAGAVALARAVPLLTGDVQSQARDALADCLGRLPEAGLRDRLADDNPEIRRAAARACAHREDKGKALAADLIPMLTDDDGEVARAAHGALTAATGQDFGPAPGAAAADREKARTAWEAWRQKRGEPEKK